MHLYAYELNKHTMNRQKLLFNTLLIKYFKKVRRLNSLRAANRNERRQKILAKHIERLHAKLEGLKLSLQRGLVASSIAVGALVMMPEGAKAQSFGPMQTNPFSLSSVGAYGYSNPTLGDIDGDGDLDLISGQYNYDSYLGTYEGNFVYFENIGSDSNPIFAAPQTNPFGLNSVMQFNTIAPTLVDLDNDGDLDIIINNSYGDFLFYENIGSSTAPAFAAPVTNPFSLSLDAYSGNSQPTFADLDNDGDLDLVIGSNNSYSGSPTLYYFENIGTASNPEFGPQQDNPFSLNPSGNGYTLYHPKLVDIDGDGDFDILAGVYYYDGDYNTPDGVFRYYENTGTASAPVFAPEVQNPFGLTGPQYGFGLDVVDIDNDGDLDIIAGADYFYEGDFFVWEGCIPTTSTVTTTEACQYIAPSGAVYDASGTYIDVIPNATNCDSIITINLTIEPITDIAFLDDVISICDNGPVELQLSSSQNDVQYYLRNDLNDTIIDGPITGDGNVINFTTGNLTTTTTYNVYAEKLVSTGGLAFDDGTFGSKEVDCGNNASVQISGTEITLEAWIYPTDWQNSLSSGNIINNEQNSPDNGYMLRCGNNGQLGLTLGNGAWTDLLSPTETLSLNTWQHVAATYDGSTMTLYVDGVEVASSNVTMIIGQSNQNLIIGNYTGGGRPFLGTIDEVRVWNVSRTENEIVDNMNECLTGSETGLQAYYQFEDGIGSTTVTDLTPNGNDGTLQNMDENTDWTSGSTVCGTCNIVMTQTATVTVNPPLDVTVTNNATSLTANLAGASYQWLDCDDNYSIINGETSQTFTPSANGNYAVEVTATGCTDTSACESISILNLEENDFASNIKIYPNPSKGNVNIDLGQNKAVTMNLVSVEGKQVFEGNANGNLITLDISSYPQGIYILQITDGVNKSFHRIIKK